MLPVPFNAALENEISKMASKLTESFANKESKPMLMFADETNTVAYSQLYEKVGNLVRQVNEEELSATKKSRTLMKQSLYLNEYNFELARKFRKG